MTGQEIAKHKEDLENLKQWNFDGCNEEMFECADDQYVKFHDVKILLSASTNNKNTTSVMIPCPLCGGMIPSDYCASFHEKCYP